MLKNYILACLIIIVKDESSIVNFKLTKSSKLSTHSKLSTLNFSTIQTIPILLSAPRLQIEKALSLNDLNAYPL